MTRLEAIKLIRNGGELVKQFRPDWDGVEKDLEVRLVYQKSCSGFSLRRVHEHHTHGPIHVRLWSVAWPDWLHISPKQLLGFIRRNYPRK